MRSFSARSTCGAARAGAAPCARSAAAIVAIGAALLFTTLPGEARAARGVAETSALCDAAAAHAAAKRDVPLAVLRALTLTETGRKLDGAHRAWPWTVNMEGEGVWFDGPDDALAYVRGRHKRGARSFDVGCFQINYKWHGDAFPSFEAMFDPTDNADYAAQFIRALYEEFGDWSKAAGAYHSRSPEFAEKYRKRFDRILASLGPAPEIAPAAAAPVLNARAERRPEPDRDTRAGEGGLVRLAALLPGSPGSVFATIGAPASGEAPIGLLRAARPLFD